MNLEAAIHKIPFSELFPLLTNHPDLANTRNRSRIDGKKFLHTTLNTSRIFHVDLELLLSKSRGEQAVARARMAAMASLYQLGLTLEVVGSFFGRHYTAVCHAKRELPTLAEKYPDFADNLQELRNELESTFGPLGV